METLRDFWVTVLIASVVMYANADTTTPAANEHVPPMAEHSEPEAEVTAPYAFSTDAATVNSTLLAPERLLSTYGKLDIGKFATVVSFKVAYPSFGPGHRVALRWVRPDAPAISFSYKNTTGLAEAKSYQQKYAARSGGKWLPIVKLDLAKLDAYPFRYNPTDQPIQP